MAHIKARLKNMCCQSSRQDLDHIQCGRKSYTNNDSFQLSSCKPYKTLSTYQKEHIGFSAPFYWRGLQALRKMCTHYWKTWYPLFKTFLPICQWLHVMLKNHALANVYTFITNIDMWRPYTEKMVILLLSALLRVLASVLTSTKSLNALANRTWDISRICTCLEKYCRNRQSS
jgi:hypothetical protein